MKYFSEDCPADFGVGEALISVGGRRSKLLAVVSSVICGLTFHSDQELQQEDRDAIPEPLTRLTTEDEDETIEERLTGVPAVDDMLMLRHYVFHEVGKGGASFVQL